MGFQEALGGSSYVLNHEERVFRFLLGGVPHHGSVLDLRLHAPVRKARSVANAVKVSAGSPKLRLEVHVIVPDSGYFIARAAKHAVAAGAEPANLRQLEAVFFGPFLQTLHHAFETT